MYQYELTFAYFFIFQDFYFMSFKIFYLYRYIFMFINRKRILCNLYLKTKIKQYPKNVTVRSRITSQLMLFLQYNFIKEHVYDLIKSTSCILQ